MSFKRIIAVYAESHVKPINTICEKNAELPNVEASGMYSVVKKSGHT
jgi:hypothetical protein